MMRTTLLITWLTTALVASPAAADPLGEILSVARRLGYGGGYYTQRPVIPAYVQQDDWGGDYRSGGSYYGRPYVDARGAWVRGSGPAPAADVLLQMDFRTLRNVVRNSAADFDRWLSGIPAGAFWQRHFETPAIRELAADVDAPPSDNERAAIVRIIAAFDRAVASPELEQLSSTPSARTLHAALRELITPPEQRLVRQLSTSGRALHRALGAISTGVSWQRYLALPDHIVAAADRPAGDVAPSAELDAKDLAQILERYDRVSQTEDYRAIAALNEFQAAHRRLAELVNPQPTDTPPPLSAEVAEELPPPELQIK